MNIKKRNKRKIKLLVLSAQLNNRLKSLFAFEINQERKKKHLEMVRIGELVRQMRNNAREIKVIRTFGLRLSAIAFLKHKPNYAPLFDERILTEKLLGRPSPGLPPPSWM